MDNYGKTIAKLRKDNGLTQSELGKALNVTYQAVSKWENDLSQPDLETMIAMCKIFGVTVDEFTRLAEGREPAPETAISSAPATAPAYNINNTAAPVESSKSVANAGDDKHGFRIGYFIGLVAALAVAIAAGVGITVGPDGIEWYGGLIIGYILFSYIALIGHESIVWDILIGGVTKIVDMPGVIFSLDIDGILFLIVYKCIIAPLATLVVWLVFAIGGFLLSLILAPFIFPFKIPRIIKDTF